ncbi:hypothetical protein BGZ60DRAFT_514475 [Tricladium varicosporioides]|nr:hypothetical protein BGZ60DRAFT_514475 [Hymenoscyphus varicosporioides]
MNNRHLYYILFISVFNLWLSKPATVNITGITNSGYLSMSIEDQNSSVGAASIGQALQDAERATASRPGADEPEFQKSLHLSIAVAGMIILAFQLFHLRSEGYIISRKKSCSTDFRMWSLMLGVSIVWTAFSILTGWYLENKVRRYCRKEHWFGLWYCLGRLAFVPWILLLAGLTWLAGECYERLWHKFMGLTFQLDPADSWRDVFPYPRKGRKGFGSWAVIVMTVMITFFEATVTFQSKYYFLGMLNITAGLLFIHALVCGDAHVNHRHHFRLDELRVPAISPFTTGQVLVLPSASHGLDVKYSLTLKTEQDEIDKYRTFLEPREFGNEEWCLKRCRAAIFSLMFARVREVKFKDQDYELRSLARWLYFPGDALTLPQMGGSRNYKPMDGMSYLGRDVAAALLFWEMLVYYHRFSLRADKPVSLGDRVWENPQQDVSKLRKAAYGGYGPRPIGDLPNTVGDPGTNPNNTDGLRAFEAAVEHLFKVLKQQSLRAHLNLPLQLYPPHVSLPRSSVLERKGDPTPRNVDDYVGWVWNRCFMVEPSTFGALYLWCSVWYLDIGNTPVPAEGPGLGIHISPLQPCNGDVSYEVEWRMTWRHMWVTSVICQLVILISTVASNFFAYGSFV